MLSTAQRIAIARTAATTLLKLGFRARRRVRRGGVCYDIDIREGIDLSLFLFGSFQRHVIRTIKRMVPRNGVVIDVGANFGAITLPVAAHLDQGHVYAIEPTDFAFAKLEANLALNPAISRRITTVKSFLANRTAPSSNLVAYSSWPVVGASKHGQHPVHKGVTKPTSCGQITLDDFVATHKLDTVSLIKVDTDGHEFAVLEGARTFLSVQRPIVVFEACEYLMVPPHPTFADFERLFKSHGFTIRHGMTLKAMSAEDFGRTCARGGSLDLVALPDEKWTSVLTKAQWRDWDSNGDRFSSVHERSRRE